jgi:hypothetical protein
LECFNSSILKTEPPPVTRAQSTGCCPFRLSGPPSPARAGSFNAPEQIWDRSNISCFALGRATGSASPLNWAEGQYLRLSQSIDAGYNLDTPSMVKAKYRGAGPIVGKSGKCIDDAGASTNNGTAI